MAEKHEEEVQPAQTPPPVEVVVPLSDLQDVDLTQHPPTGTLPSTWKKRDLDPSTDLETFKAMLDRAGLKYEQREEGGGRVFVVVPSGGATTHVLFVGGELVDLTTGY